MTDVGVFTTVGAGSADFTILRDALVNRGHSVAHRPQATSTQTELATHDVVVALFNGLGSTTAAALLDDLMAQDAVPVIVGYSELGGADPRTDALAGLLGVVANERRSSSQGAEQFALGAGASDHPATRGYGGQPSDPIRLWETSRNGNRVATSKTQRAGSDLLVDGDGDVVVSAAEAGANRVGSRAGETFPVRVAYFGALHPAAGGAGLGRDGAVIAGVLVEWAAGVYDGLSFPSSAEGVRFPAIDLTAVGDLNSSQISWTQTTPGATSVVVSVSTDGETFSPAANGGAIPGVSGDLTGVFLTVQVDLLGDGANTPTFGGLSMVLTGTAPALRQRGGPQDSQNQAPDGWFDFGHLRWISGANAGIRQEVKRWTSATREIVLFLPAPFAISAQDQFEILPGCDKTVETCRDKFANVINFRGEPFVPGQDKIVRFPDAVG